MICISECRCKKGNSCSTNRIRGKCAPDPDHVPTTIAPEKCWYIKPSLPEDYELAGPCVFPLNHGQRCRLKCENGKYGFAQCWCRNVDPLRELDEFEKLLSGRIDIGSASISIGI